MSENGWRRCALFSCPRRKNSKQDSSAEVLGESCVFSGRRERRPIEKNPRDIYLRDIQQRDESDGKTFDPAREIFYRDSRNNAKLYGDPCPKTFSDLRDQTIADKSHNADKFDNFLAERNNTARRCLEMQDERNECGANKRQIYAYRFAFLASECNLYRHVSRSFIIRFVDNRGNEQRYTAQTPKFRYQVGHATTRDAQARSLNDPQGPRSSARMLVHADQLAIK